MQASPIDSLFTDYQTDPQPEKLHAVVKALRPTIDYALTSLQAGDDPVMRSKAQVLAAHAVKRYSPLHGATLPTWVSQQLLPLRRARRQTQSVIRVPERIQLDAYSLAKAEKEFVDKFDREPDVTELADFSNLSPKRIASIRKTMKRTPSETAIGEGTPPTETDFTGEALDYIMHDASHIDRRILEMKTGYGGTEIAPPWKIAQELGLSPTQLTRQSQKLQYKIQKIERQLHKIQ